MSSMQLDHQDGVYILTLTNGDKDNTFNPEVLREYHTHLDEVEAASGNAALLLTSSHPKTFCNGIDLPWLMSQDPSGFTGFLELLESLLLRVAVLNLPVITAITGNCYAGGAILASATDFRLMRADRGRFCFSEVNIKIPFTQVMIEVIKLLPDAQALRDLAFTGVAVGGVDCLRMKVADSIHSEAELQPAAMTLAAQMAQKHRPTYTTIKRNLRPAVVKMATERGLLRA